MRKLKLDIDALAVESFDTETPYIEAGTVHGQENEEGDQSALLGSCVNTCQVFCAQGTNQQQCGGGTAGGASCAYSCGAHTNCGQNTCADTCYQTCYYFPTGCNNGCIV